MKNKSKLLKAGLIAATLAWGGNAVAQETALPHYLETPGGEKPRVVITTDPELDDLNTLIRYLLYSADFRTEGLIYSSSQFHWKGDGKGTKGFVAGREYDRFGLKICPCTSWRWAEGESFIDDAVDAYAAAYPNLRIHDPDYPAPELLKSKIRWGNVQFDGEMEKDTAGSDRIKSLILDDENSPIYLHAWGGQSTIARALKSIEEQYKGTASWADIRARVIAKAVIHASGDQDDTYEKYIKVEWPDIRYVEMRDGPSMAYAAQSQVSEQDAQYFSAEWTRQHISRDTPLGKLYRVWGDGKHMVKGDIFDFFGYAGRTAEDLRSEGYIVWTAPQEQGSFSSEGDTPTFLNLVDNGLRGYRGDSFGGWGGLLASVSFNYGDALEGAVPGETLAAAVSKRAPTHPFLAAIQNDFAVRMAWAASPDYADANHAPWIKLLGGRDISAKAGQEVPLRAVASDPDGDTVSLRWWRWDAADSYNGPVAINLGDRGESALLVPKDAKPGDEIHVIAEATDNAALPLTRYDRVVIKVIR